MSQYRCMKATSVCLQDVIVSAERQFISSLTQGKTLTVEGTLFYQACNSEKCYLFLRNLMSCGMCG